MSAVEPEVIDSDFVPQALPDVAVLHIGNEIVLGRLAPGSSHLQTCALNASATIVWQCFDGSGTIAEIALDIAEVFGADVDDVITDVESLARQVGSAGFLAGVQEQILEVGGAEPEGIAVGLPLLGFEAVSVDETPFSSEQLRGRRALLVSWSPTCTYCDLIAHDLADLVPGLADAGVDVVLLATGGVRANLDALAGTNLADLLVFQGDSGALAFNGLGTPVAYLVDEAGLVAAPLALGAPEVLALARRSARRAMS